MNSTTTDPEFDLVGPVGWRFSLLGASLGKRALATLKMTAGERLEVLERLAAIAGCGVTEAAIAAVEPADAISAKIICEAMTLDPPEALGAPEAAKLLSEHDQFSALARLNPSLVTALKLCGVWH